EEREKERTREGERERERGEIAREKERKRERERERERERKREKEREGERSPTTMLRQHNYSPEKELMFYLHFSPGKDYHFLSLFPLSISLSLCLSLSPL